MRPTIALSTLSLAGSLALACGGSTPQPETGPDPVSGPITMAPPTTPSFQPQITAVATVPGRVRSMSTLPDGSWFLSRLFGTGASPATLPAAGGEVTPLPGWSPLEVLALRPSPDGTQIAWTKMADQAAGEVWVRPVAGGDGRKVAAGYLLSWLDAGHVLTMTGSETTIAQATIDVVAVASGESRTLVRPIEGRLFRGAAASPDGASVAFLAYPVADASGIEASDVYVVPAAGGEPRPLTTDGAGCLDVAWTSDGRFVLHSAQRGASRDIWAVPAAGGSPVLVASTPAEEGVPAQARGGALRFATFEGGAAKALVWEVLRAGGPRVLAEGDADRTDLVLSPDGFRFAYVLTSGRASNIIIGKFADGSSRAFTETAEAESMPVWAPDASSIVYLSRRESGVEVVLHLLPAGDELPATVRRSEPTLTNGAHADPRHRPAYSPDGRQLLYAAAVEGKTALMRVPLGGGDPVQVAPEVLSYAWDPRQPGAVLVVRPKQGGGVELVRVRTEGRRPPEVLRVDARRLMLLQTSSSGNAVFALEEGETRLGVVKVDLATGRRDPVLTLPEATDFFRLSVDVTPDGRYVTASIAEVGTRIQELTNFSQMTLSP